MSSGIRSQGDSLVTVNQLLFSLGYVVLVGCEIGNLGSWSMSGGRTSR